MRRPWAAIGAAIVAILALVLMPSVQMVPQHGPSPQAWLYIAIALTIAGCLIGMTFQGLADPPDEPPEA